MTNYLTKFSELMESQTPFVSVILIDATGSTPQDQGSKMLVTADGLQVGTVGGGSVEEQAIKTALELLNNSDNSKNTLFVDWNLKKELGMVCGGSMKLFFEAYNRTNWEIVIFGSGHVGIAVCSLLANLECKITCFDNRQKWLDYLPSSEKIRPVLTKNYKDEVKHLPRNAFILSMTTGHQFDLDILSEVLKIRKAPFVGVIGSKSKRKTFDKELQKIGIGKNKIKSYHCPVGLKLGTNQPYEIAVSIVSQMIQERDRIKSEQYGG
jgi:xanthine dehydrogenase accessory factor